MSLFEKSNMVSPFAMHQQQLAMLAHQQSLLMAAAGKSVGGNHKLSVGVQQPGLNGVNLTPQQQHAMLAQYQSLLMAAAGKSPGAAPKPGGLQQLGQNGVNITAQQQLAMLAAGNSVAGNPKIGSINLTAQNWPNTGYQIPRLVDQGDAQKLMQTASTGSALQSGSSVPYPTSSFYSVGQAAGPGNGAGSTGVGKSSQSAAPVSSSVGAKEYDFSSLTQGMFSKR